MQRMGSMLICGETTWFRRTLPFRKRLFSLKGALSLRDARPWAWLPSFASVLVNLSNAILECFTHNAYYCWKGLFKGARDTSEGVCAGTGVEASDPPLLSVSAMLPARCQNGPLCLSLFLLASGCHKLTVDVHTWPAPGHTAARIDGCSAGWGVGGGGGVLTACQRRLWRMGPLSPSWVTSFGRSTPQTAAPLFASSWVWWRGCSGLSMGQWATTFCPELGLYVPHGCFPTKTMTLSRLCRSWKNETHVFILNPKQTHTQSSKSVSPVDLPTILKEHKQQDMSVSNQFINMLWLEWDVSFGLQGCSVVLIFASGSCTPKCSSLWHRGTHVWMMRAPQATFPISLSESWDPFIWWFLPSLVNYTLIFPR